MSVMVTGSSGFIGKYLVGELRKRGEEVYEFDIVNGDDVCNPGMYLHAHSRVFHLAAQTDAQCQDAMHDARVNILGTINLLERYGSRVVLASSSMVNYPVCPYAVSKSACEDYAMLYGAAVVRLCNVWGDGGHSVYDKFKKNDVIEIRGDGTQMRTFAHVSSAVDMLINAVPGRKSILTGVNLTVNQIAGMFPGKKQINFVASSPMDPMEVVQ